MFRVGIDMDQPLARINDHWLTLYNKIWKDDLTEDKITSWDIHKFVKPECGTKIYDIIKTPGFYRGLPVREGAVEGVQWLLDNGFEVGTVSASPKQAFRDKYEWIKDNFPMIDPDNICFVKNKSWANCDFLIDDGVHNLEAFKGIPLLYSAPWNEKETRFMSLKNWDEIITFFKMLVLDKKNFGTEKQLDTVKHVIKMTVTGTRI